MSTLLNSGNAVFEAPGKSAHAPKIRAAILARLRVECEVVVKNATELDAIVAGNPFAKRCDDPSRLLVAFAGPEGTRVPGRNGNHRLVAGFALRRQKDRKFLPVRAA